MAVPSNRIITVEDFYKFLTGAHYCLGLGIICQLFHQLPQSSHQAAATTQVTEEGEAMKERYR